MVSITFPVDDSLSSVIEKFSWVNWSKVGSEKLRKREIFEKFIKTGEVSAKDQEFCDKIGWDPIDELELREEYVEKLKAIAKKPAGKPKTIEEFNRWCESL